MKRWKPTSKQLAQFHKRSSRERLVAKQVKHWFVVALEKDGTELARVTVTEDGIGRAVNTFSSFADWVEVVDPEGKVAPRTVWPREGV